MNDKLKALAERYHPSIQSRNDHIRINRLAVKGGEPYIAERLSRWPGEPAVNFYGYTSPEAAGSMVTQKFIGSTKHIHGRMGRTSYVNHCGRVVSKVGQHVFRVTPTREGVRDEFLMDADRAGNTLDEFMKRVLADKISAGWTWVKVDMPTREGQMTLNDKGLFRPYLSLWTADMVVDWKFGLSGKLMWIILEYTSSEASDPFSPRKIVKRRRIEEPGRITTYRFKDDDGELELESETAGPATLPWACFGDPFTGGYWMDDVEGINRTIMNLSSAGDDAIYLQMYGQLVIPAGLVQRTATASTSEAGAVVQTVLGMHSPIEETAETKNISRYISPNGADLEVIYKAINSKKGDLFERVGMALKLEGRAAESAEAKSLDKNDEVAMLSDFANELEDLETRLAAIANALDPTFAAYEPQYNRTFRSGSLSQDLADALAMQTLYAPDSAKIAMAKGAFKRADDEGKLAESDDDIVSIMAEFDGYTIDELDIPDVTAAGDE